MSETLPSVILKLHSHNPNITGLTLKVLLCGNQSDISEIPISCLGLKQSHQKEYKNKLEKRISGLF